MITIHETPLFPETYPLDRLGKRVSCMVIIVMSPEIRFYGVIIS